MLGRNWPGPRWTLTPSTDCLILDYQQSVVANGIGNIVVSYTRARAEALGVECKVGIADRLVRVIILSAGLVFADLGALEPAVYVLAALSSFTVVQRILHVRRELAQPASL